MSRFPERGMVMMYGAPPAPAPIPEPWTTPPDSVPGLPLEAIPPVLLPTQILDELRTLRQAIEAGRREREILIAIARVLRPEATDAELPGLLTEVLVKAVAHLQEWFGEETKRADTLEDLTAEQDAEIENLKAENERLSNRSAFGLAEHARLVVAARKALEDARDTLEAWREHSGYYDYIDVEFERSKEILDELENSLPPETHESEETPAHTCPLCGDPATSMPWSPPEFPERLCERCVDNAPDSAGIQAALIAKRRGAPQEVIEALRDAYYP